MYSTYTSNFRSWLRYRPGYYQRKCKWENTAASDDPWTTCTPITLIPSSCAVRLWSNTPKHSNWSVGYYCQCNQRTSKHITKERGQNSSPLSGANQRPGNKSRRGLRKWVLLDFFDDWKTRIFLLLRQSIIHSVSNILSKPFQTTNVDF